MTPDEEFAALLVPVRDFLRRVRPEELPGVGMIALDVSDALPAATSAVYFLWSASKGLLYIGKAGNLRNRWRLVYSFIKTGDPMEDIRWDPQGTHSKLRDALELGDVTLHWLAIPRDYITLAESLLVQAHTPPWNNHRG